MRAAGIVIDMTGQGSARGLNTYALLSLLFSFVIFPPVGIYLGYKAREQIDRTGESGSELATIGIWAGWIFTGIFVVAILIWCVGVGILAGNS